MSNPYQSPESSPFDPPPRAFDAPPPTPAIVCAWLSIVLASLSLLCSPMSLIGLTAQQPPLANGDPHPMNAIMASSSYRTFAVISIVLGLVASGVLLAGGIGLLKRKPWGRTLTVGYAAYTILMAVVSSIAMYVLVAQPLMTEAAAKDEQTRVLLISTAIGMVAGGFCGGLIYPMVLLILMNLKSVTTYYRFRTKAASADPFLS